MDTTSPPDIVVVAGGAPVTRAMAAMASVAARSTLVIAADSGVATARSLGLDVDVAVGDFDSLDPALVAALDQLAGEVRRHPVDKSATDLELALAVAAEGAPARLLVLGLEGGRPDHALANLLVMASPAWAGLDIELALERGRVWVVRDQLTGRWPTGTTLSIIPVHGPATVSVRGVRWPLDRSVLDAGTTRGISNTTVDGSSTLTVHDGVVLCIVPEPPENPE